jgi:hypothetical protein
MVERSLGRTQPFRQWKELSSMSIIVVKVDRDQLLQVTLLDHEDGSVSVAHVQTLDSSSKGL